jgi:thioredoxin-related protein
MPRTHFAPAAISAVVFLVLTGCTAPAQEIRWRHDYAAARREANETGKPLLLDFGTEACFWCKKLDTTTFRDPRIARLINDGFIPVKIDGNQHSRLVEALEIDSFPTLILATPTGKVVARHPGYADVAQMTAFLAKAPTPNPPPVAAAPPKPPVEGERQPVLAQIEADLAALAPRIAASLDR